VLVDRCFAFSPAVVSMEEWRARSTTGALQVFRAPAGTRTEKRRQFDSVLRPLERNGWAAPGGGLSPCCAPAYRTVLPEYYNLRRSARTCEPGAWDPRNDAHISLLGSDCREPAWRFTLHADAGTRTGHRPSLKQHTSATVPFNMRTLRPTRDRGLTGWRWKWGTSIEASRRDYGTTGCAKECAVLFAEGVAWNSHGSSNSKP